MSTLDPNVLLARIDELLATVFPAGDIQGIYEKVIEVHQGTVTLARAIYGDVGEPPQLHTLMKATQHAREKTDKRIALRFHEVVWPVARGTLAAMRADVVAGLVGSLRRRVAGEVIFEMLALAKEARQENTPESLKVAAVLAAASFEDALRRMGSELAGVAGRPDLADVHSELRKHGVLKGAAVGITQSYLSFRNRALHADWANVDEKTTDSCIALAEGLLAEHFS